MTPLSRRPLSSQAERRIKGIFISELVKVRFETEMKSLMSVLLTDTEKLQLAKRLVALVMIDDGLVDVQIAKALHVTRETASRWRSAFKFAQQRDAPVIQKVRQLKSNQVLKQLLKEILLNYALPAA